MTTAREALGPTHEQLQAQVIELAHLLGWQHLHVRRSIGKGRRWVTATNVAWPDLTCWAPGRGIRCIEVKIPPDKPTREQQAVLDSLEAADVPVMVVTPANFDQLTEFLGVSASESPTPEELLAQIDRLGEARQERHERWQRWSGSTTPPTDGA